MNIISGIKWARSAIALALLCAVLSFSVMAQKISERETINGAPGAVWAVLYLTPNPTDELDKEIKGRDQFTCEDVSFSK